MDDLTYSDDYISDNLSHNDSTFNALTQNDSNTDIFLQNNSGVEINNTFKTKDHWIEVIHNNKKSWRCLHCQNKVYSCNTSRTYLKNYTLSCSSNFVDDNHNRPMSRDDMDDSIVDLVIGTGISFNVIDSPLFHRMARKLYRVTHSYKIPHSTTVSRHLSGNIFDKRLEFVKEALAKTSSKISFTYDGWYSTVHKCHYMVVTVSWISTDWEIVNIILNFQESEQTAIDIKSAVSRIIQSELPNNNIISIGCMCHILNLIIKAGLARISELHKKIHKIMKYLANPLASEEEELIELKSVCQLLKLFEAATLVLSKDKSNSISDALTLMKRKFDKYWNKIIDQVIIAHVLDPRYKMEHLKTTLIEIGEYSELAAEQFVNNIRQIIIQYGANYTNTNIQSSSVEVVGVDHNNSLSDTSFPKRCMLKRPSYNINTVGYELILYKREPPEEIRSNDENNRLSC
ncbi:23031_t:CDS:2 [Dentiscutata erythropus]|uniref:23031_t:CDS:1 n=1 Tax=Dentiscutata erythropus TaxID=1348616 RepID=A0A9N9NPC2_9GLOM|nr:23031_t:CDS:2 [Dentiscutata erythropus]